METGDENVLNELDVDVWDQGVCTNRWGSSYINDGHVCVGTGDTGACNVSLINITYWLFLCFSTLEKDNLTMNAYRF